MSISYDRILVFSFFLILILFPVNYKIISFLRPVDLFIIIFSLLILPKLFLKRDFALLFFSILLIILFSTVNHISSNIGSELGNIIFLYKIIIIYVIAFGATFLCLNGYSNKLNIFLFWIFIFLIFYAYIYYFLINYQIISGHIRISFPFTNAADRLRSDAHLYGNYLALNLTVYIIYWRKILNHSAVLSILIQLFCIISILLSGSKNPLLILFLFYSVAMLLVMYKYLEDNLNLKKLILLLFSIFGFLLFIYIFNEQILLFSYLVIDYIYSNNYHLLFTRIYYFLIDPLSDDSTVGRINNLIYAISIAEPYNYLLGRGLSGSFRFFDGIHSLLIALGGFSLLFLFVIQIFVILGKIIFDSNDNNKKITFIIFFSLVLLSNLITEFIFVTRWMIPIVCIVVILYYESFEYKKIRK